MSKRAAAIVQAEWSSTIDAINELDLALGNRPWDMSIADTAWRNPHAESTPYHAACEEVHAEAMRLARKRDRLRAELERAESQPNVRRSMSS